MTDKIDVRRKEWAEGELVEIHDPAVENNPAAVLPGVQAEEIARQILEGEFQDLVDDLRQRTENMPHTEWDDGYDTAILTVAEELEEQFL